MSSSQKCSESFLDGITDIYLCPIDSLGANIPYSVAQTLGMSSSASLAEKSVFHISTLNGDCVTAESITAKTSISEGGNGRIYTAEVTASVLSSADELRSVSKSLGRNDYHTVLRTAADTLLLGYSLPGTFSFQSTASITQTEETRSITISLKSMSDFIPFTINP